MKTKRGKGRRQENPPPRTQAPPRGRPAPASQMQTALFGRQAPARMRQAPARGRHPPSPRRQALSPGRQTPAPGSQAPAPGSQAPAPGSQAPAPGSQAPAPGRQAPTPARQAPAPARYAPAPGRQAPAPGRQAPAPGRQAPAPGRQAPAPGRQAPAPGRQAPAPGRQAPAPGRQAPAPGSQGPSSGSQAPRREEQMSSLPPSSEMQQPKKSTQQRAGEQSKQNQRTDGEQCKPQSKENQQVKIQKTASWMEALNASKENPVQGAACMELVKQASLASGTKGKRIVVEVNHVPINLGNLHWVLEYEVTFKPDKPMHLRRQALEVLRSDKFPLKWFAFDGCDIMYVPGNKELCDPATGTYNIRGEVIVKDEHSLKSFELSLQLIRKIDLWLLKDKTNSHDTIKHALDCVDIVMRNARVNRLVSMGNTFYSQPQTVTRLGDGMELYEGFYQAAASGWKTFLNIDAAHRSFPIEQNVSKAAMEILCGNKHLKESVLHHPLPPHKVEKLSQFLKDLKIIYHMRDIQGNKQSYTIKGLGEPACRAFFKKSGKTITVAQYFRSHKCCPLKYPNLPTLQVVSNSQDKILLPMELCTIKRNQIVYRTLTNMQTRIMREEASTTTTQRKEQIMDWLQFIRHNDDKIITGFGFRVVCGFQKVNARQLDSPILRYQSAPVTSQSSSEKWTITTTEKIPLSERDVAEFIKYVKNLSQQYGMNIVDDPTKPFLSLRPENIRTIFQQFEREKYRFVFVLIPTTNSTPEYNMVKSTAALHANMIIQCLKSKTALYICPEYPNIVANVLRKVLNKLTNVTCHLLDTLDIMKEPIIIMGVVSVIHYGPASEKLCSLAAVTSSYDAKASRYHLSWRLQPSHQEDIADLAEIVKEKLQYFYKKNNGLKPRKVIMFRESVSENQSEAVRLYEIAAIKKACMFLEDGYKPKITIIMVQKQHHTRMFPIDPNDFEGKQRNVPVGTVIDTEITNPIAKEFYLLSHASSEGVSRPTKYSVVHDENDMESDVIQEFTYSLCHMITRYNMPVSCPTPSYYAYLAAVKISGYIRKTTLNMNDLPNEHKKIEIMDRIQEELPMFTA